ncbi:MAG: hypothetical protein KatS3mg003_1055 [Candidatus Nitrosocaldaceae archaeon]|nr:MAG: hypothetical protein KatS3mg003_1055 [Candidatus Nitrosocaldaceae archaeon]
MHPMIHNLITYEDKVFFIVLIIIIAYILTIFLGKESEELKFLAFSGFFSYIATKMISKPNVFTKQ